MTEQSDTVVLKAGTVIRKYGWHKEDEDTFDNKLALAFLLAKDCVFLNSYWWEDKWPEDAQKRTAICVNCNDIFAWGCADAEDMFYSELRDLWEHYIKDPEWGTAVWCMKRRKLMPQPPVEDRIRKAGIWDLDGMDLRSNPAKTPKEP